MSKFWSDPKCFEFFFQKRKVKIQKKFEKFLDPSEIFFDLQYLKN